jgi:hypothetical protein
MSSLSSISSQSRFRRSEQIVTFIASLHNQGEGRFSNRLIDCQASKKNFMDEIASVIFMAYYAIDQREDSGPVNSDQCAERFSIPSLRSLGQDHIPQSLRDLVAYPWR